MTLVFYCDLNENRKPDPNTFLASSYTAELPKCCIKESGIISKSIALNTRHATSTYTTVHAVLAYCTTPDYEKSPARARRLNEIVFLAFHFPLSGRAID